MKLNWINVVATLLIVAGIFLLIHRSRVPAVTQDARPLRAPSTNPITTEEIKDRFIQKIESTLGRPLNDIEKQMITVDRKGDVAKVTLLEPLKGRFLDAERQLAIQKAKLAASTMPSTTMPATPTSLTPIPLTPVPFTPVPASPDAAPAMTPLPTPTTAPGF